MVGDGSKIYMCDFFYGRVYADLIANPYSMITEKDKASILAGCPQFKDFGEKFMQENQRWLKRREQLGEKNIC